MGEVGKRRSYEAIEVLGQSSSAQHQILIIEISSIYSASQ